jgi:hypothetical protein
MKHSKLGIASLCIAVFTAFTFLVMMVFGAASTHTGSQPTIESSNALIGSCMLCLTFPSLITGSIFGLISLFQKDTYRIAGIVGIVINALEFFLIIGLAFIGMMTNN